MAPKNVARRAICVFIALWLSSAAWAGSKRPWDLSGLGFFEGRKLSRQLDFVLGEGKEMLSPSEVEDAALVLVSYLQGQGYLGSRVEVELVDEAGNESSAVWDQDLNVFLPRGVNYREARFRMQRGPLFFYDELGLSGNARLGDDEVEAFFYSKPMLLQGERSKVYTPGGLRSAAGNLAAHYASLGFLDARVEAQESKREMDTGAIVASTRIVEGPLYRVEAIAIEGSLAGLDLETSSFVGLPYSRFLAQDIGSVIRNAHFKAGYPDVQLESTLEKRGEASGEIGVSLRFRVKPGEVTHVGTLQVTGLDRTRLPLVLNRIELEEGDLFNPIALDDSRLRISRLGAFKSVSYSTESTGEGERSVTFALEERPRMSLDGILGWGSYERLRGGFVLERINLFGMAHRLRIKSMVSLKSSLFETRYLIPEFVGDRTALSSKVFALEREEISFDRQELGVNFGLSRYWDDLDLDTDLVYTYQLLEARNSELATSPSGDDRSRVGSLELRLGRDRRDNPINPRKGYRLCGQFEWAAQVLGGESNYGSMEIGFAKHGELSSDLFWHVGLSHGAIRPLAGDAEQALPTNKLFFPGGENSIRGYQRGGAAPVDAAGARVAAFSYVTLNLELEQLLSERLSAVLFWDGLGTAASAKDYPFDATLSSVGIGLRLRTLMGPVRLEYGHNLNRRPNDPEGTLHFSIGFPF